MHGGSVEHFGVRYEEGDVIGCFIDALERTISKVFKQVTNKFSLSVFHSAILFINYNYHSIYSNERHTIFRANSYTLIKLQINGVGNYLNESQNIFISLLIYFLANSLLFY